MSIGPVTPPFGALLKRHWLDRGLSREVLGERAGVSLRAVSDLERGLNRAPRHDTPALLVAALQLAPEEEGALEAAACRVRAPLPGDPRIGTGPARTNLPLALTSFVGPEREQAELTGLLGTRAC
jgi:transcriptional regulator with XRE-family HTH domain